MGRKRAKYLEPITAKTLMATLLSDIEMQGNQSEVTKTLTKIELKILKEEYNTTPYQEVKQDILTIIIYFYQKMIWYSINKLGIKGKQKREDLYQECIISLMTAWDRYDSNEKTLFSTYFSFYIKKTLMEKIGSDRQISPYYQKQVSLLNEARLSLEEQNLPLTDQNLVEMIEKLSNGKYRLSLKKFKQLLKMEQESFVSQYNSAVDSIGYMRDEQNKALQIIRTAKEQLGDFVEIISEKELYGVITYLTDTLTAEEKYIFDVYFNRDSNDVHIRSQIAEELGITTIEVNKLTRSMRRKIKIRLPNEMTSKGYDAIMEAIQQRKGDCYFEKTKTPPI